LRRWPRGAARAAKLLVLGGGEYVERGWRGRWLDGGQHVQLVGHRVVLVLGIELVRLEREQRVV
jgi:hypothetical protein